MGSEKLPGRNRGLTSRTQENREGVGLLIITKPEFKQLKHENHSVFSVPAGRRALVCFLSSLVRKLCVVCQTVPPQIHILELKLPVLQSVVLFGHRVFTEVTKVQ